MIELKKYKSTAEITQLGAFKTLVPKGAIVRFLKNNFTNPDKRVVVNVKKGDLSANVSLTSSLSKVVRELRKAGKSHQDIMSYVVNQEVIENEQGKFISMPAVVSEGINIDTLKAPAIDVEALNPEELAW